MNHSVMLCWYGNKVSKLELKTQRETTAFSISKLVLRLQNIVKTRNSVSTLSHIWLLKTKQRIIGDGYKTRLRKPQRPFPYQENSCHYKHNSRAQNLCEENCENWIHLVSLLPWVPTGWHEGKTYRLLFRPQIFELLIDFYRRKFRPLHHLECKSSDQQVKRERKVFGSVPGKC